MGFWDPYGNEIIKVKDSGEEQQKSPQASQSLLVALKHPFRGTGLGGERTESRGPLPPSSGKGQGTPGHKRLQMQWWPRLLAAASESQLSWKGREEREHMLSPWEARRLTSLVEVCTAELPSNLAECDIHRLGSDRARPGEIESGGEAPWDTRAMSCF